MITRFRLEAAGISTQDAERQLDSAIAEILTSEGSDKEDWDTTDFVAWKDGLIYRARIVMKLKGAIGERDSIGGAAA